VTSIAGSVLINCLPVLGLGIVIAARGRPSVAIGEHSSELQNLQLLMSGLLLALPSIFYGKAMGLELQGNNQADAFSLYSATVAVLTLGYYLLGFRLQQSSHDSHEHDTIGSEATAPLSAVLTALGLVSLVVAVISDRLVDALELVVSGAHLSELFVGLFLLPLFGCLPEMLITLRAAANRNMTLVMTNTVDSSLQLLLFVLPLLVLAGLPLGRHLHLALPPVALAALGVAVVTIDRVTDNREVNAYEGLQLMVLFAAMALGALLLISP
jgi:Ca2+:H+ antiporter